MPMVSTFRNAVRQSKLWIEGFAQKPYAFRALFTFAFIEAALLPVAPDILLVALGVVAPRKALRYGLITALGSFLGGFLGYSIGYSFFGMIGRPVLEWAGASDQFSFILAQYRSHGLFTLIAAGFTPIPYAAFTIVAGFDKTLSITALTVGSAIGRFIRFMLVGALLYYFGPRVKQFIDRYYENCSLAITAVLIVLIVAVKFLF